MRPAKELLPIYRAVLDRYEAEGNENTEVQRRLVAQLEAKQQNGG